MNKKIAAGLLDAILGVTGISMPEAVECSLSEKL